MDDYLMHYGVLGMRWGVHKANSYDRNEKRVLSKSYEKKMRELGYDDDTINLVKKKLNKRLKEKKKQNLKESRQQMELSKTDSTMTKEDFANKKYKAAKFKRYQKRKIDYDNRNIKRYKENLALYAAGLAMPGPIVSDLIGLGAAIGNDVRSRKERKIIKSRLDKALNTEITSLANKITEKDIHKIIKHGKEDTMNSSDFNDLKELGNAYLEHYGVLVIKDDPDVQKETEQTGKLYEQLTHFDMSGESFNDMTETGYDFLEHYGRDGMKWGVRNGPPYPLNKEGLRSFREHLREKRAAKRRRKILNNPKKLAKHIDEFTPEELAEEAEKQHAYNDIAYQRKWGLKKQKEVKLSNKQKRMANNAVSLLQNVDEFSDEEYSKAVDRLHKREHLKDVIANSTQRPAQVIQSGANILYSVKSGAGSIMSMHDMYNKAFGGATYDESHAAWLNNNKEPVSGKLWSRVIGESNAAKEGRKYEYKDASERSAWEKQKREQAVADLKFKKDHDRETQIQKKQMDQAYNKQEAIDKRKDQAHQNTLDRTHETRKQKRELAEQHYDTQRKWDLYNQLGAVPFENVRTYNQSSVYVHK